MHRPCPKRLIGFSALLLLSFLSAAIAGSLGTPEPDRPDPSRPRPLRVDPFALRLQTTVRGGLAVGATCLNYEEPAQGGPTGGDITIDALPPGATVLHAWLYWSVLHSGPGVPMGTPTFEGESVAFDRLGEVPLTPCFSPGATGFFRADVTALVPGNGTYALAGFPGRGNGLMPLAEGATLFVVWCEPTAPLTDIVLFDGAETLTLDEEPVLNQLLTGFAADPVGPVTATLALAAGNGQLALLPLDGEDGLAFNGVDLDALHPEILSGNACPRGFYDLTVVDVSGFMEPGDTSAEVTVSVSDDCYTVAAVALAVRADPTGTADACEGAGCGGALDVPAVRASCGGAAVDVDLSAVLRACPTAAGAEETGLQLREPLTALDADAVTDLGPPFTIAAAEAATLALSLDGRTDLEACTMVELIDPTGFRHRVKEIGAPLASPYDARSWYVGPGEYRLRLLELTDCGSPLNDDASLSAASLTVRGFPAPAEGLEYRVEDASGAVPCDWSESPTCRLTPSACPGTQTFTARVRCLGDPSCSATRTFELGCGLLAADFTAEVPCGSARVCFESEATDGFGAVATTWDFAGEGASDEAAPCFEFSAPPPWTVTMSAVDELGCRVLVEREVARPPAPAPLEPSALDRVAGATPLRVRREAGNLTLEWEDLGPGHSYHLYRGELGLWYSHEAFGWCGLASPSAGPALEPGDHYFLAVGVSCDATASSTGRDASGAERPGAAPGLSCP